MMAAAVSTRIAGIQQIVLAGDDRPRAALAEVVARKYLPFSVMIDLREERREALVAMMPFLAGMKPPSTGAAAYVCRQFSCQAPVGDPSALEGILG
jgi:hypothetical protein